mgnify:CR=1 FL=1
MTLIAKRQIRKNRLSFASSMPRKTMSRDRLRSDSAAIGEFSRDSGKRIIAIECRLKAGQCEELIPIEDA